MRILLWTTMMASWMALSACGGGKSQAVYTIGGSVSGLAGDGVTLQLNGANPLRLTSNGSFSFPATQPSGSSYAVTVSTQPATPYQTCAVTNGSGTVGPGPVTNIAVSCTINDYTVGGSVSGLTGSGLILTLNGTVDLSVAANGAFVFPGGLSSESNYSVTVKSQPSAHREMCSVSNAAGTITGSNIGNVTVTCMVALGFVFVSDPNNAVVGYSIDPTTGALLPTGAQIGGAPMEYGMVAAPSGRFLYVANTASHNILVLAVDPDYGALTLADATASAAAIPRRLILNPNGSFLYVIDNTNTVQTYAVNTATGALSSAGTLALPGNGYGPPVFTPDGKFLYLLSLLNSSRTVTAYMADSNSGALTAGASLALPGDVQTMAIDPLERFVYFTDAAADPYHSTVTVESYSINSGSAALTATGQSVQVSSDGAALAADPTGEFLYVLGNLNNGIYQNSVIALSVTASTGALSQIGSIVRVGSDPASILCDPSGKFVFTGNTFPDGSNPNWNDVTAFSISQSGATAGQVTPAGQGALFSNAAGGLGAVAVIE